jgi:hypothetical protein
MCRAKARDWPPNPSHLPRVFPEKKKVVEGGRIVEITKEFKQKGPFKSLQNVSLGRIVDLPIL